MSVIQPFKATHYNPKKYAKLEKLVCPPYDIISKEHEKKLKNSSAYNYTHVLLRDEKTSYEALGARLRQWVKEGVLVDEDQPALYLVEQEYKVNGTSFRRRGFLGLVKLTGKHAICPHEKTHAKPKIDRMMVLKHVKANLSPIFIIYQKKNNEPTAILLKKAKTQKPFMAVTDTFEKVKYRIWKITDKKQIASVQRYFNGLPLMIADGHHRREVATDYCRMKKAKEDSPLNHMLTYFSPVDDNLLVLPTHRVYVKSLDIDLALSTLDSFFNIQHVKNAREAAELVSRQKNYSFVLYQSGEYRLCVLKDPALLDDVFTTRDEKAYKSIDSFLLHKFVFAKLLEIDPKEGELLYTIHADKAVGMADQNKGCAFIIKATKIEEIMRVAVSGLTMPQKTTYFYPKVLSGLVLRRHEVV
jgi:uncharacterized protein (DUF1015 family)